MLFKHSKIFLSLLSSLILVHCQTSSDFSQEKKPVVGLKRPFRLGFFKLSPSLDKEKTLAPADYAGWVESGGLLLGSPDGREFVAFSLKNKTQLWSKAIKGDLTVPAYSFGESVIISQKDGTLTKLDLQNSQTQWEIQLPSFVSSEFAKNNERIFAVTANQILYAINAKDGNIEWFYDAEVPNEMLIQNTASPVVFGNQVYWGLSNGELVALESKTGKIQWRRNPKVGGGGRFHNYMGSFFVSNKNLVFCRYDGLIGAASLDGGELVWQVEGNTGNCVDSDYRGGRFYAVTTSGDTLALNADTGQNLWHGLKLGRDLSTISAIEDSVFVTGADGQVYSLGTDASLLWYDRLEGRILSHPVFIGKEVYVSTGLKNIYAYKL